MGDGNQIKISIKCPQCQEDIDISEELEFGKIYEFTCHTCKVVFVLAIPNYILRVGKIEGLVYGENSPKS